MRYLNMSLPTANAGIISARRSIRRCAGLRTHHHHRAESARRYYAGFAVRRAADHPGYQRHANDPGATAMVEITVSGGCSRHPDAHFTLVRT